MDIIELAVKDYLSGKGTITEISRLHNVKKETIIAKLTELGYIIKKGCTLKSVIGLKNAVEEYIATINNKPSLTKIASKYGIKRQTLSNRLKELGYTIINYQNITKFNEHIFDVINSEEKAYWLGFIYADGYIDANCNCFELSLKSSDSEHLYKFNKFMEYEGDNVKFDSVKCNGKICGRARWYITNKHLWNTLNSLGIIPNKSLKLVFPNIDIFVSKDLIKHFIRGYVDGDGCISYNDPQHKHMNIGLLGTYDFLMEVQNYIPSSLHKLQKHNNVYNLVINGSAGYKVVKYLYENSTISLSRKYEKYLEYCRLYEESYKELSGNIGKTPEMENPEINSETKKSESSYSVEGEPK